MRRVAAVGRSFAGTLVVHHVEQWVEQESAFSANATQGHTHPGLGSTLGGDAPSTVLWHVSAGQSNFPAAGYRARFARRCLAGCTASTAAGLRAKVASMRVARSPALSSKPAANRQKTLNVGCFDPASMCVMNGRSISQRPAKSSCVS